MSRTWTWRNPMGWPMTRKVFILALAATYLPLAYVGYGWGPDHSAAAAQPTVVNHYETPCYARERTARGIPALSVHQDRGLLGWERSHQGTPEAADFHAALAACDALEPVGKWDWGSMVLVSTETLP